MLSTSSCMHMRMCQSNIMHKRHQQVGIRLMAEMQLCPSLTTISTLLIVVPEPANVGAATKEWTELDCAQQVAATSSCRLHTMFLTCVFG